MDRLNRWWPGRCCEASGTVWLGYATVAYRRYGYAAAGVAGQNASLDRFLPAPEIAECHKIHVGAPSDVTFAAAREFDLRQSWLLRAIFSGRQLLMRSPGEPLEEALGVSELLAGGWGILLEEPGRGMVFGAVAQPWHGDPEFRALAPGTFATLDEPGWAKIVWTLAADSLGPEASVFRTETRVTTTDAASRERFRRYWAVFSPGILLIRRELLRLVKGQAEQRVRGTPGGAP